MLPTQQPKDLENRSIFHLTVSVVYRLYATGTHVDLVKERWTHKRQIVRAQGDGGAGAGNGASEQLCQGWKV